MDINTQLDGFIIHPLDAFKDSHQEEFIPQINSSTNDFDEFQVHPLDNFFAQEHNNINLNEVVQENDYYTNNETYDTGNIINTDEITVNNLGFEQNQMQDLITPTPDINIDNNDLNLNQYEITENFTTQEYPVTYTDSTSNYNYINSNSSDIIPLNNESNFINPITTASYENYSNTNNDLSYSKILPTKILPTIERSDNDDIIPSTSSDFNQITTEQNEYIDNSITSPINNEYTIPSDISYSKSTFDPTINIATDISLPSTDLLPSYSSTTFAPSPSTFNDISESNYKVDEYNIEPNIIKNKPIFRELSYNPKISWKKVIPKKTTIIIPKVKKYIIKRKSQIILPKKQTVIIPSVIVQPQPTIQMPQIQPIIPQNYVNMVSNTPILISTIPSVNQNSLIINSNRTGQLPMQNLNLSYGSSKIYYPRNFKK